MADRCRSCGAAIRWESTETHKAIPLDAQPRDDGNMVVAINDRGRTVARKFEPLLDVGLDRYVSHFATCPNAAQHRRGR